MWLEETPVEAYKIGGATIYVKREDLFGQYPAPPLAKLRGARVFLNRLKEDGWKTIGVFDTRISKAGQGVAVICKELKLECITGFPQLKSETTLSETHKVAQSQGASLMPVKAGRTAVCYAQFARVIREKGGFVMPLGLVCKDTVMETARVARETLRKLAQEGVQVKTIVISTGTGTIAAGVSLGSEEFGVKVFGVSCGMDIRRQYRRTHDLILPRTLDFRLFELIKPEYEYYEELDTSGCPFPTNPWYDMKAWVWMLKNLDKIAQPILFWNIGC